MSVSIESITVPLPIVIALVFSCLLFSYIFHISSSGDKGQKSSTSSTIPNESRISEVNIPSERYRFDQEQTKRLSSEYTRRGVLWTRHATWHLPDAPRIFPNNQLSTNSPNLAHVISHLKQYDIDSITGFLPTNDPLQRLPFARYHVWEDLADDLPKLLGARLGQARAPLRDLPVLATDKLMTSAELRRAHLLLCLFAHAYVWGGAQPLDHIPEGIARPLCEVSARLGIPPVLGHPSIVLYNWRRLDVRGEICMENLCTLNNFFAGRDESWFYLITVEVEAKGAKSILPMMLALDAIHRYYDEERYRRLRDQPDFLQQQVLDQKQRFKLMHRIEHSDDEDDDDEDVRASDELEIESEEEAHSSSPNKTKENIIYVNEELIGELSKPRVVLFVSYQLQQISLAIQDMTRSITSMREGCLPYIFYHRVRPFLSGWKHNPTMPKGVIYEGVFNNQPQQYFGGSAAQSALLPFLDITLGVLHDSAKKSKDFLIAMREYMLSPHREFLKYLERVENIRDFVLEVMKDLPQEFLEKSSSINLDAKSESETLLRSSSYEESLLFLRASYDQCVQNLKKFRNGHMSLVMEYILQQQDGGAKKKGGSLESTAGGKGTGGTDLMSFLKPIRDDCDQVLIAPKTKVHSQISKEEEIAANAVNTNPSINQETFHEQNRGQQQTVQVMDDVYYKDNGCVEDIDLYRGASIVRSGKKLVDQTALAWRVINPAEVTVTVSG